MSGSSFKLKGGAELLDLLSELPAKWVGKVGRGGARAAAAPIRDEARTRIRSKSGRAAKSIKTSSPRRDGDVISVKVQMKGKHAYVGIFLEGGVKPHEIERKGLKGLSKGETRAMKIGADFVSGPISHPGFGAMPFMRPALDAKAKEAVNAFGEYVRSRLTWGQLRAPAVEVEGDNE